MDHDHKIISNNFLSNLTFAKDSIRELDAWECFVDFRYEEVLVKKEVGHDGQAPIILTVTFHDERIVRWEVQFGTFANEVKRNAPYHDYESKLEMCRYTLGLIEDTAKYLMKKEGWSINE